MDPPKWFCLHIPTDGSNCDSNTNEVCIYTWNLFVLYFGGWTLQNKAFFKQNRGYLGSRYIYMTIGGGNSNIFYFHPELWGDDPIWLYIYIYNIFQTGLKPPIRWWSVQNSGEKKLQLAKKNTIFPIEIHPNNCCCHSCRHAFLRHPSQRSPQLSGVPVDLGSAFFQLVERWRKNLPYFPHFFPMGFHNIAGVWQDFWIIDSFF